MAIPAFRSRAVGRSRQRTLG